MGFQKTSELLLNEFYKFVNVGACEAGVFVCSALIVTEGSVGVAGGAVDKSS